MVFRPCLSLRFGNVCFLPSILLWAPSPVNRYHEFQASCLISLLGTNQPLQPNTSSDTGPEGSKLEDRSAAARDKKNGWKKFNATPLTHLHKKKGGNDINIKGYNQAYARVVIELVVAIQSGTLTSAPYFQSTAFLAVCAKVYYASNQ